MEIAHSDLGFVLGFALLTVFLWGCQPGNSNNTDESGDQSEETNCPELDNIFSEIESLEGALKGNDYDWAHIDAVNQSLLGHLQDNMQAMNPKCLFINHENHPTRERFGFLDPLSAAIIQDEHRQAMNLIFQLRILFQEDPLRDLDLRH